MNSKEKNTTLPECFAMRGQYANQQALDEETLMLVQEHFSECQACREWRVKHRRVLEKCGYEVKQT